MTFILPVFGLLLLLVPGCVFADWNVRGMNNSITKINTVINKDASITIDLAGRRFPASQTNNYLCSSSGPLNNMKRYLVWFVEDIKVNGIPIRFQPPSRINDAVAQGGYFTVEKSQWDGDTLIIVGSDGANALSSCGPGGEYTFSSSFTGKAVGVTLPAGSNNLSFGLRIMRIQDSEGVEHAYQLALTYRHLSISQPIGKSIEVHSYCTNNNVSSVTLNHKDIRAGTGNGKWASATVMYECNLDASTPVVTFTGADIISGNQVKICDGLFSELSAKVEKMQGYNFKTEFKSTLKGNAPPSCAGTFSKNIIATISPP